MGGKSIFKKRINGGIVIYIKLILIRKLILNSINFLYAFLPITDNNAITIMKPTTITSAKDESPLKISATKFIIFLLKKV